MGEQTENPSDDAKLDQRVTFKSSDALLSVVDLAAARNFSTRSDYIRGAVVERLRRDGVLGELRRA